MPVRNGDKSRQNCFIVTMKLRLIEPIRKGSYNKSLFEADSPIPPIIAVL